MMQARVQDMLLLANVRREQAGGLGQHEQAKRGHDDLAVRNQNAASDRAIPDAHVAVASVFANNVGHVVTRRANVLRKTRMVVQDCHAENPQRVRDYLNTTVGHATLQNRDSGNYFLNRAGGLTFRFRDGMHLDVHHVQYCSLQFAVDCATLGEEPASVLRPRETPAEAGSFSVSAPNNAETAATDHSFTGSGSVAADYFHSQNNPTATTITTSSGHSLGISGCGSRSIGVS